MAMQSSLTVRDKIFEVSAETPSIEEVKARYFGRGFEIVENNGICGLRFKDATAQLYGIHEAKKMDVDLTIDNIQKIIVDGGAHWPLEEMMDGYTGENPHPYTEYARTIISRAYFGAKTHYVRYGILVGSVEWDNTPSFIRKNNATFRIATKYDDPAKVNWVMLYTDKPIGIAFSRNWNSFRLADGIWAVTMPLSETAEMHLYQ